MTTAIMQHSHNLQQLVPAGALKDEKHRLTQFVQWLDNTGGNWHAPDLAAYRDVLAARGLKPASISAHLSTIRGRYNALLTDNAVRSHLYSLAPVDASAADRKAFVDETLEQLRNAIEPAKAPVRLVKHQDTADDAHLRLTIEQANSLLEAPGVDTLHGLRDTAIIALMLCTGIREMELCALNVADLRQYLGGALALHVREGKGAKRRLIPYGEMDWCLLYVDKWLALAGIEGGAVFRGFYKGGKHVRANRLSVRAVQDVLARYPLVADGRTVQARPHDLRRTYARRLYDAAVPILAIQQNLAHSDHKTTEGYIGTLDAGTRKPPRLFKPPHLRQLSSLTDLD